ncbi:MAG: hypothetical protein ACKVJD_12020, partial [Burkholderiales bacterium]
QCAALQPVFWPDMAHSPVSLSTEALKKFGNLRLLMHCLVCGYTIERQLGTVTVLVSSIF